MRRWGEAKLFVQPRTHGRARITTAAQWLRSNSNRGSSIKSTTLPASSSPAQKLARAGTPSFVSALHPSRVLQKPFIPSGVRSEEVAAALHDACRNGSVHSRHERDGVNSTVVHELTLLPVDELVQRVHRFSRTNFSLGQRPLLYAHLQEIMKPHRMAQMSIKALQDYLHLAHVAGLHETCLEVYHTARKHMSPATLSLHSKKVTFTSSNESTSSGATPDRGDGPVSGTAAITKNSGNSNSSNSNNLVQDSAVLVSNYVVDSAYAVQSSAELTRMASYCVSQLLMVNPSASSPPQQDSADGAAATSPPQPAVPAVRSAQEMTVEVALVRCLWRVLCLAEYYRCTEAGGANGVKGSAEQALADALAILEACQRVGAARRDAFARLRGDALFSEAAAPQRGAPDSQASPPRLPSPPPRQPEQLMALLQKGLHFVRYASAGDDGEFAFFHFCMEKGILTSPQPFPCSLGGRSSGSEGSGDAPSASSPSLTWMYDADEVQVFYGSLIETCSAGQLVPEAMLYFTEARRLVGCDPLADEDDSNAEVHLANAEAREGVKGKRTEEVLLSAASTPSTPPPPPPSPPPPIMSRSAPAPPPPLAPPAPSATRAADARAAASTTTDASSRTRANFFFTDFLLHRLLFTLQTAKDNRRIVRLARALIAAGAAASIKANLWTLLLISAGAVRAADVVLVAHTFAMQQLSNTAGGGGGGAEASGSGERRTWEYLLQTTLSALSKCQLPHYEQDYLQPAQDGGVVQCTDEFYYGCLLQDAHNSMNPVQRAAEVLARMSDAKVPLTAPLVSRLLKLYLRVEAVEFLAVYRHAAEELHLRRGLWTDQLVLWADRRRYFLSADDRAYIVDEVLKSRNVSDVSRLLPMLGGLRAQFALLHYDFTHAACDRFLQDGTLPDDAPTMQDSRAHFLTTRAPSVQRGVMAPAGDSWVCARDGGVSNALGDSDEGVEEEGVETEHYGAQPRLLGDSPRRTLHAAIAELSETPLLLPTASGDGARTAGAGSSDEERLHDEALRVYLADVLGGLQRSLNSVS
ncbi:hypothetical protein ABB37_03263 [Leptomonas pyrrhocoris]|uniref:Uncharacterized protein n=1 Tax=Leptomonas pyrrhocoris TaxID=157538 RepID=A0A0M9G4K4_LEPPY|nr:hypothetical protein ABB37_03263 [Leptomonas pyrrhocoris]KPA82117.1 hypothetical protein ABB37_03263 [Leptomonas pyrrhocoris]|eukprot:XP_015660556.1 hypothetical protein ABB37_03263 [Leptomonas pyrrhocoris]